MFKTKILSAIIVLALPLAATAQVANGRATTSAPSYSSGTVAPLSLDTSGNLRVINSGSPSGTQDVNIKSVGGNAVTTTVPTTAAQSGTWTVQPGNTANTTPWLATINQNGNSAQVYGGAFDSIATNNNIGVVSQAMGYAFNGTTWDRIRSDPTATGTQWQIIRDAAGNARGANVDGLGNLKVWPSNAVNINTAIPSSLGAIAAASSGNAFPIVQADKSAAINVSSATTTQLVALSGSTKIYVTSFDVIAGGTGTIQFEYGTGTNCGTGTTALTGAYPLTAQAGIAKGSGLGPVLVVPAGNALCVVTSAAVQMSGSISYTQF